MGIAEDITGSFFKNLFEALGGVFKRKAKVTDVPSDFITIRELSKDTVKDGSLATDMMFIVMIHNGGKKLMPHGFKYRSIVGGYHEEWSMPKFKPQDYKYLELDFDYIVLVDRIFKTKEVGLSSEELPKDSKLAENLQFEGVKYARYFYLNSNSDAIWLLVAGTVSPNEELNSNTHKHKYHIVVNKIKQIIKKY